MYIVLSDDQVAPANWTPGQPSHNTTTLPDGLLTPHLWNPVAGSPLFSSLLFTLTCPRILALQDLSQKPWDSVVVAWDVPPSILVECYVSIIFRINF